MLKTYQKCVRKKPIGYDFIKLANFFKSKISGHGVKKISALLVPILITNLMLNTFVPLKFQNTASACITYTCPNLEYKIEPVASGSYALGGGTANLTVNGDYFDWTATIGIERIIVKGGPDERAYDYSPLANSGNGLSALINSSNGQPYGLSNIRFCYDDVLPVRTYCGDSAIQNPNSDGGAEECDDGADNGMECTAGYGQTCTYCSADCLPIEKAGPDCGDGHVDTGEECDDGNIVSGDGCSATCTTETPTPSCGDGHVDTGEECDDGNLVNDDGCSCQCDTEIPPACGDGVKQENEECDDGNLINFDGCNAHCQTENFSCTNPIILDFETDGQGIPMISGQRLESSYSGLGVSISADNLTSGHPDMAVIFDSAHPSGGAASLDHGTPNEFYGGTGVGAGGVPSNNIALYNHLIMPKYSIDANQDGYIDNPTEDGAGIVYFNFSSPVKPEQVTLIDIDHNAGQHQIKYLNNTTELSTQPIATFGDNNIQYVNLDNTKEVTSLKFTLQDSFGIDNLVFCPIIPRTYCGDSLTQNPNSDGLAELCDAGQTNGQVCTALYGQTCTYCSSTCQPIEITGPKCGDGVKNGEEACDHADGVTEGQTCSDQCTILDIPPSCGDGTVEAGETCDQSTQNGIACTPAYGGTCTYCSATCSDITLTGPSCGDGVKNGEEQCDDGNTVAGDGCSSSCTPETPPPPPPPPPVCTSGCGGGGFTPMGPRILISKTKDVINACSGTPVTYTVKITNIGNEAGRNLTLTDTLPTGWTYATTTNNAFNYSFGDITPYQTVEYSYAAHIPAMEPAGTYRNTAVATITNGVSPNNTAQASVDVKVLGVCESAAYPILNIRKSSSQTLANPEDTFNYTITVGNTGSDTAYNVDINDILPTGFSAVNGTLNWNVGDINPGESKEIVFPVKVGKDTAAGTYTNIAKARASNHNEISATADIEVRPGIILAAEFEELPDTGPGLTMLIYFTANILALAFGLILFRKTKSLSSYEV